jgi:hypothetical protein
MAYLATAIEITMPALIVAGLATLTLIGMTILASSSSIRPAGPII